MPIVNGHRTLLSAEAEKKLKAELEALLNQKIDDHHLPIDDIAKALHFGEPPYENLKTGHVCYYIVEFGFEYHSPPSPDPPHPRRTRPRKPRPIEQSLREKQLREDMRPLYFAGFTATKIAELLHITEKDANHYLEKFFHPRLLNRIPPPQYISSLKTKTTKTETPEMPETDMLITVITK